MTEPAAGEPTRLRYEPALDGIRGLAVVAVLLYHGQVAWMRGGFLGVDLFFVLSGYLITSLLLLEWARTGTIDLAHFWSRRARRLLPALFMVLLAVCAYATCLARPSQRESLRWDVLSTLAYLPNWRSALGEQSYFAQYGDPSPLRHMWSLGIEEQFYLLFPVLLLVWLGLSSGRFRGVRLALLAGAAGSALLMLRLYDPQADPSRVYYGTDTRAQALLVGALLAAWAAGRATSRREPTYLRAGPVELPVPGAGALGLLGLAGFVGLAIAARDLSPWLYRGGFLLVAVCCAAMIAGATRAGPSGLVVRALSWAPLRAVGLVSYGLYLWHWPVYVVVNPDRTGLTGLALLGLRLATTAVLAVLSFWLVEQPVRRGRRPAVGGPVRPGVVAIGAAVVVAVAAVAATPSAPSTPVSAAAQPDVPAAPGALRTFIIGDSVAWVLWSKVRQRTVPDLEVRGSTQLGCGLIAIPVVVEDQVEPLGPTCDQFDSRWPTEVAAYRPDVAVLMLGVGEQFDRRLDGRTVRFGTPAYTSFLHQELDERVELLGGGVRPVVLVTVPCHRAPETGVSQNPVIINDEHRVRWLNSVQRRYARSHADQVHLVDLHGFLCPKGYTDAVGGVDPLRTDGVHFTRGGVQLIWRWLGPQLVDIARGAGPRPVSAGVTTGVDAGRRAPAASAVRRPAGVGPRTGGRTPAGRRG